MSETWTAEEREMVDRVRARIKGMRWFVYVCAEPDGQDCDSGTHPNIVTHRCAAIKRLHERAGEFANASTVGPRLVEVEVMAVECRI